MHRKDGDFLPLPAPARVTEAETHLHQALQLIMHYGAVSGDRQRAWLLDQVTRVLAGDNYEMVVAEAESGERGAKTYVWDEGVSP